MIATLLQELAGPSPGKAGGLASMTAGAAGAALFSKCRYPQAAQAMESLQALALDDGAAFENYISAKRAGQDVNRWLTEATESPLRAAEISLGLLERLPQAKKKCPKSMIADLLVGACLLDASTRGNLKLVETNLRLFYSGWSEGESRLRAVQTRLDERDAFAHLFGATESIAVIGISDEPNKPAFYVPSYLKEQGYRLWGIHPRGNSDLAEQTTLELKDLNNAPDLVLIFRRSEKVSEHLDDLLSVLPRFVWMQQGIRNDEVAEALRAKGVTVVSDRCAMVEHQKLF